ncbi:hypothetical protein JTB14_005056 [Gonioctena quinquepunctata]|nr:hypothetical protein JTB14_005056 [Gonioctena quinquepunctata]
MSEYLSQGRGDRRILKWIRLSGAARKRFEFLIKQGLPVEETRVESVEPVKKESTSDKRLKRVRSETKTPDGQLKKKAREAEKGSSASMPTKPTSSEVTGGVKVGILPKNYLEVLKEGGHKASFPQLAQQTSWVALMCALNTTMQWLESTNENINLWEGVELRVVEEAEMSHNEILVAHLPGSQGYSTEKILGLIEAQNESINATNWMVLRRASDGPLELLTLSVEHQSAERLRKTVFFMNYKFGHTTPRPKSGKPQMTTVDLDQTWHLRYRTECIEHQGPD